MRWVARVWWIGCLVGCAYVVTLIVLQAVSVYT